MRASEVLGCTVVDAAGVRLGIVGDLRVRVEKGSKSRGFPITGLVVSRGGLRAAAAIRWGFAEGRAQAPLIFKRLLTPAIRELIFVPIECIEVWSPGEIRLGGSGGDLPSVKEALSL
jgi:hypothetical protein